MKWVLGASVLVAFGLILRRLLRLGDHRESGLASRPLDSLREAVFQTFARETEAQAGMLAVILNDAIGESEGGRLDMAWKMARLAADEWSRLSRSIMAALTVINDYMPVTRVVVPARQMGKERYLSPVMFEYARTKDFTQQFVFHSKLRFQMHLGILRKAVETLTEAFTEVYGSAQVAIRRPSEPWCTFDLQFHDLDLLAKESLLAFRSFLMGLPDTELRHFSDDLEAALASDVQRQTVSVAR